VCVSSFIVDTYHHCHCHCHPLIPPSDITAATARVVLLQVATFLRALTVSGAVSTTGSY